jgi:hypothetical protein
MAEVGFLTLQFAAMPIEGWTFAHPRERATHWRFLIGAGVRKVPH